ncbi:hypothetical protein IWX63_002083 [Arthrobacter sp. CAN_A2]|uniref:hypothetical protein n=1 Tax=Arthrobacter sp. CAN_A2 TaxID=2787718 RepID=UPI0018EFFDA3
MQHKDTLMAMEFAGLSVYGTWMHCCAMGGAVDYFEFDAYLHGILGLDAEDADLVSQAVNELIDDVLPAEESRFNRAPYPWKGPTNAAGALRGGIPLPPGAPPELLGGILDSGAPGRFAADGRA